MERAVLEALGPAPDSASKRLERLRNDPLARQDPDHAARLGYLEAALLSRSGRSPEALRRIREVDAVPVSDPDLRTQVKNFRGRIAYDNDEYEEAIAAYHSALDLAPGADSTRTAVTYNNLARVYERLKQYDDAFDALERSVAIYEAQGDSARLAGSLLNLGVVYFDRKRYSEAQDRFIRSLAMARAAGLEDVECIALESLGNVLRDTGRPEEALASYNASMEIAIRIGDREGLASVNRNMGDLHLVNGAPALALPHLLRTLALADSMGSRNYRMDGHRYLARAYRDLDRPAEALPHLEAYIALKDSVLNEEKNKAIANWQVRFETAEKERTILEQQMQRERDLEALLRREQQLWALGAGGALALVVLALLLRDRVRARNLSRARIAALEQEKRIGAMHGVLEGEERERQRVAAELHDGVGILLSAARMRLATTAPGSAEKAGDLVEQATHEVRRISRALMPGSLVKLGLPDALHQLAEAVNTSGSTAMEVHVHGFRERLPRDVESGLYRITQEAVNNALRHAGASRITVEASVEDGDRVSLVITDDGRGFDPALATNGHGQGNMRTRATLMHGTASLSSAPGKGTTWAIDVPIPAGT